MTNATPAVSLNAVGGINENGTASLSGSFTDAGSQDSHTVTINWGDGGAPTVITPSVGTRNFSATHQYLDDKASGPDTYTISVSVADNLGATGSANTSVAVANVAPAALSLSRTPASISENQSTTLNGSFTDPGTLDAHTVTIAWGDGGSTTLNLAAGVLSFSAAHQYLDDNAADSYTISVTVTDDDGGSVAGNIAVGVTNVAPHTVTLALSDNDINESETIVASGTFADPGTLAPHTVTVAWGDGSPNTVISLPVGVFSYNAVHTYADDNASDQYTVTVTVTDDDGGSGVASTPITVRNVAPALDAGSNRTVNEGDLVALNATFQDAGLLDTFTATVNWGDGTTGPVTP